MIRRLGRWSRHAAAVLGAALLVVAGCDFGQTAAEVEAEENALRAAPPSAGTVAPRGVTPASDRPATVSPPHAEDDRGSRSAAERAPVFHLKKRGMDEEVPPYYPGVGPPIEDPPGPCPPPLR